MERREGESERGRKMAVVREGEREGEGGSEGRRE